MVTRVYAYRSGSRYYYSAWDGDTFHSSGMLSATLEELALIEAADLFASARVYRGEPYVPSTTEPDNC